MDELKKLRIANYILAPIAVVMDIVSVVIAMIEGSWLRVILFLALIVMISWSTVHAELSYRRALESRKRYEELISRMEQMKED